jgi:hypothetical protein
VIIGNDALFSSSKYGNSRYKLFGLFVLYDYKITDRVVSGMTERTEGKVRAG